MHRFFIWVLDFIFPPSADALRVRSITENAVRAKYTHRTMRGIAHISAFTDPYIRALIHEAKFHGNSNAHRLLCILVCMYIQRNRVSYDVLMPIPLSPARMRTRGYNQVLETLRAGDLPVPIDTDTLIRTRDTRPQTELSKMARLGNVRDAFGVAHPERITNKRILLIDDVTTTGSTLHAAKTALLPHKPASITLLAIAH